MGRINCLLVLLALGALLPVASRLVFDSVAHLGSLRGARADASFLLSFMELGRDGTRFVVAQAPNGSVLTSVDGGVRWSLQRGAPPTTISVGSYATWPTVYANKGGWPPESGYPVAYATTSVPVTYEPAAPTNFSYTGTLAVLSAERRAPCLTLPRGKALAVGAHVSWTFTSHDPSLCAFPSNGSRTTYEGHVCGTDGSIQWDNLSTPYHPPGLTCAWPCSAVSLYCGDPAFGGFPARNPILPTRLCGPNESSVGATFHANEAAQASVRYNGLPAAAVQFIPGDGNVVRLRNGTWIATVGVWFASDAHTNVSSPGVRCCNDSVVVFRSDDQNAGLDWEYVSTVAGPQRFAREGGDEGPNENALVMHPDGETLSIFLRTAGGEGFPAHHHEPYWKATSTDGGLSWHNWSQTPNAVKSGRPAHATVGSSLLLSSGRPALGIHESPDGVGGAWISYDIPTEHNRLIATSELRFCEAFENAPLDGSLGWTQTSGVTTLVGLSERPAATFLVCYNRVCCPTVRTDCHATPPPECSCNGTDLFCMRGRVIPSAPPPPPR